MLKDFVYKFFAVAALVMSLPVFAEGDYHVENQPKVLEAAVQLPHKGVLKQKPNGYLYVEVSRDFIATILPLIEAGGKIVPPQHYTSKKGIGAHISVMYENEQIENEIWSIKELNQEFNFSVKELRTVKLNKDNKIKKLWLLAVSAPALEKLRASYGLTPLLKNHDFHITIGAQVPGKAQKQAKKIILREQQLAKAG